MPSNGFSWGARNVFEHWRHWNRWLPLRSRPWRLHSIRQLWQVTVISPIEIHSGKPDNEGVSVHRGFGCDEQSPVRDWRLGRGFFIAHESIVCLLSKHFKKMLTMHCV